MQFEGIITESETSCTHLEVELSNVCNGFLNGFEFLTFFHPGHCLVLLSILKKLCYITKISPTFSVEEKKAKRSDKQSSISKMEASIFHIFVKREAFMCTRGRGRC